EVEKRCDEFAAAVQCCSPDDLSLELHEGLAEQPRLTLPKTNELRQVTVSAWILQRGLAATPGINRPADLLHHERFPQPHFGHVHRAVADEVLEEGLAPPATIDVSAELGIERHRSF